MVSIGTRTWVPRLRMDGRPFSSAIISMRVRQCSPCSASSSGMRSIGTSTSTWPRRLICSAMDVDFHLSCPGSETCTKSAPPTPPPMASGPANGHTGSTRSSLASSTSVTSPVQKRSSRSCGSSNTTRTSSPGNTNRTNTTRPSMWPTQRPWSAYRSMRMVDSISAVPPFRCCRPSRRRLVRPTSYADAWGWPR